MSRPLRTLLNLAVSAGVLAFLLWQIDVAKTVELIGSSDLLPLAGALAIFLVTTWMMAWRWQALLAAKGIREPLSWLTKLYFIGYAASNVLPTSIGGDAVRIVEHNRKRGVAMGEAAGAVLMERAIGSVGTLIMVAAGLVLAIGRYDDIAVLIWLEIAFVVAMAICGVLLFSKRVARSYSLLVPAVRAVRLERAARSLYRAMHEYRSAPRALLAVLAVTLVIQLTRTVAIWLCGESVGVELSPLVYIVLGPLLFLVMMVPFTINGLGVREVFFVEFLARFDVDANTAFATGFLFFAVTVVNSLPGGAIMLWRSLRGLRPMESPPPGEGRA